jgi:hypothetical protein
MFLITGCGRSGTGWASALFTSLGYYCGHEDTFSYDKSGPLVVSESSWLAVPHLSELPQNTPVIRIMRNPYEVVQSVVARGFLDNVAGPYEDYVERWRPDITSAADHLGRAIRWVALWDDPLSRQTPILRVGAKPSVITALVQYATGHELDPDIVGSAVKLLGTRVNTTPDPGSIPSIDQISGHPDGALIITRAREFGYL